MNEFVTTINNYYYICKLFNVTLDKITWIKCLCNPAAKIKMDQHILKEVPVILH